MYKKEEVLEFYKSALKKAGFIKNIENSNLENFEVQYSSQDEFHSIILEGVTNTLEDGEVQQIGVDEITKEKDGDWTLTEI